MTPESETDGRLLTALELLSFAPFVLLVLLYVVFPDFGAPVFDGPPDIAGVPLGAVVLLVGLVWAAVGVVLVNQAGRTAGALAGLLICGLPSTLAVVFAPSIATLAANALLGE